MEIASQARNDRSGLDGYFNASTNKFD